MRSNRWRQRRRLYWQDRWKLHCGCQICGYNKHAKALSFDHLTDDKHAQTKNGQSRTRGGGMWTMTDPTVATIRELVSEWRKCRILCMNCHMEQRFGVQN